MKTKVKSSPEDSHKLCCRIFSSFNFMLKPITINQLISNVPRNVMNWFVIKNISCRGGFSRRVKSIVSDGLSGLKWGWKMFVMFTVGGSVVIDWTEMSYLCCCTFFKSRFAATSYGIEHVRLFFSSLEKQYLKRIKNINIDVMV